MSNKFIKKRDMHEGPAKPNPCALESRISIHINDKELPQSEYERVIRDLCSSFGKIKTIHIPKKSKTGNLVFVEFVNATVADKAIKFINSDRELHMVANPARAPKNFQSQPSSSSSQIQNNTHSNNFPPRRPLQDSNTHVSKKTNGFHQKMEENNDYLSWRSPRESEQNRPMNKTREIRSPRAPVTKSNGFSRAPPASDANIGPCVKCGNRADLKCNRCGDFYCSRRCQNEDWPVHRRVCIPMPELIPASEPLGVIKSPKITPEVPKIISEMTKVDLSPKFNVPVHETTPPVKHRPERSIVFCDEDPKSGDTVAITWPCSTNRVYIVQNDGKMGEEYRELLNWASRPENHGPPLTSCPEKGTLVFAEFENEWYRAIIQKVLDTTHALVAFFDFGNAEPLHFSKLREYTGGDDDVVRYTYGVYLKDCPYNTGDPFPANVAQYLKSLADEFIPLRLRYTGEWNRMTNVELFVKATDVCVNDKICALLGASRAEYRKNKEVAVNNIMKHNLTEKIDKIYFDDLPCERMNTENKTRVKITCRDAIETNTIWCHLESASHAIKKMHESINEHMSKEENLNAYVPEENEVCLVKVNDEFKRAVLVSEIDDQKANVMLVDFGEFRWIPRESIFKMDKRFCDPIYTHMCQINGFPCIIEGDLLNYLKTEIEEDSSFIVEKITFNEDDEIHVLYMPRLVDGAIADGYLSDETLVETN